MSTQNTKLSVIIFFFFVWFRLLRFNKLNRKGSLNLNRSLYLLRGTSVYCDELINQTREY
ncbi:hypothetical protein BpHYR1_000058 [Brachionus plicatilis]|uniref:Uncharacterized protein n=1 Tax=Brachionus plicatilis TaxID=10195 RepID=A0A3M7PVN7_BRAPC|nr:hypothetical protein BpHYR1_000058 [Brachionus plicatilis]